MRRGKDPATLPKGRWNVQAGAEGAMHAFMVAQSTGAARWKSKGDFAMNA